jgi:hypothetical protein
MKTRTDYFRRRRAKLASRRRCTRCGTDRAKEGAKLCPACLAALSLKRTPTPQELAAEKRKRLLARLELVEEARGALLAELDRVA